jgi:hypothetical protein
MGARASGLGQAANGGGKILGPLSLALIAGTANVVAPQATMDAVLPAFNILAVSCPPQVRTRLAAGGSRIRTVGTA